ncbi:MAG: flagellar basal-body rod protein FlgG [Alphaproteobacteria bacterium]|nr:flagellar basal-body rod protein FlgG [Alphaproteobacteria bacterium]
MRAMNIAATGMHAQQLNVEVISHNIANINTTSYKRQRAEFQDLLYENIRRPGAPSTDTGTLVPAGIQIGLGVKTAAVYRIGDQGSLQVTQSPLDIAIEGDGFFQIDLPDGTTGFTRAGSFQLNAQEQVVTADGFLLQPGITIDPQATDIAVNASGEVLVKLPGQVEDTVAGQITLAGFANPAGLEAIGGNLFLQTAASGDANVTAPGTVGLGTVRQGFLEASNVNVVAELTSMITAQRAYEMNSKVIQATDEMYRTVTQMR